MIERLWRSLKYECIYLHAYESGSEVRQGLRRWIDQYNTRRPHSSLDDRTPDEAYWQNPGPATLARLSNWRHNHEGFPPYSRRQPVLMTGATLYPPPATLGPCGGGIWRRGHGDSNTRAEGGSGLGNPCAESIGYTT